MAKKKQTLEEQESPSLFDKTLSILDEKYGEGIVSSLEAVMERPIVGLSTGSIGLDYIISPAYGGMPKGKVLEMYGPYSSGKTTIALGLCANATANREIAIYVDAEGALAPDSIIKAGVDKKYFKYIDDMDARRTANILEALMKTGEVGIVVIDSVPAWRPLIDPKKGEEDVDFTKPKMAFQASFLSDTLPHLSSVAKVNGVLLVLLNQIRNNLSGYGAAPQPFGGHVLKHTNSVRLKLSGKVSSKDDRIVTADGAIVGQYTTALADKNKTAIPMQEIKVPLFLGRGINPYLELVILSQKVNIVDGTAGRFKWTETGEPIAHGANAFAQLLFDDVELYKSIREKVITKLGVKYQANRKVVNAFHDEKYVLRSELFPKDANTVEALEEENDE